MTRDEIRAALTERQAAIATLYGETRGESLDGIVAAGCVLRNRATHPRWWGTDLKSVCLTKLQFSCWWETGPNSVETYAVAEALIRRTPMGERTVLSEIGWIVDGLIGEQLRDITASADHYVTTRMYRAAPPHWAKGRTPCAVVNSHTFFRLEI